jgi:ATP-dependent Clp protease ATP-binding subunit ClpA
LALEPLPSICPQRTFREAQPATDVAAALRESILGQDDAIETIAPYVELSMAGLAPEGRPAGVFLLLGPTGTGKTRTVEALAQALHGSDRYLLRVDCGEFQLDHEVAKLIGAPPGYLGHRETHPMLSQQKVNAVTSESSPLSLILFDEIEKAAPSFSRILLGVLDRATLKLGDNTSVNFENSLIFLTSNLGARGMMTELAGGFGFSTGDARPAKERQSKLSRIAMNEVRRRFSPEFVNRIDEVVTYQALDRKALEGILEIQLTLLRNHIRSRLGPASFDLELTSRARKLLLSEGTSTEYGARELKRAIHRLLMQPLGRRLTRKAIPPASTVVVDASARRTELEFEAVKRAA